MSNKNELSFGTILLIIMTAVITGYTILLLLPTDNLFETVITKTVYVTLLPMPDHIKANVANNIIEVSNNYKEIIRNIEKTVAVETTKYLPKEVVKSVVDSVPRDLIDDNRCVKKPSGKFPTSEIIPTGKDLPWDEMVDDCVYNKGTLDDIDLNERVKSDNPKVILY